MLPGPLLVQPPSSPSLVLIGHSSVPSVSPSATPSSSTGSSIAIVAAVGIATVILTFAIVVLRRSCRRHPLSCTSFSHSRSLPPTASSSAESEMQCAAAAVVGASLRASASAPKDAEGSLSQLEAPVLSAPYLPEVEQVILDLLSQPPALLQQGISIFCCICTQDFVPTDMILALPVCSHKFHQSCIVTWLRRLTPARCPFCSASITIPHGTGLAPAFCSDDGYDIEAQMRLSVPAPPGEEVAEAVGGSHGWLRSSVDRLSGSWNGCSSNRATAVVVPVSSRRTTRSWSLDMIENTGINSNGIQTQMQSAEEAEAIGGFHGWLHSYLATLSATWSGWSCSPSTAMVLPVSSREMAVQRTSVFNYARWLLRNSG